MATPAKQRVLIAGILLLFGLTYAGAFRHTTGTMDLDDEHVSDESAANSTSGVAFAGQLLQSRYKLQERLGSFGEHPGKPSVSFPTITVHGFSGAPTHLGQGSFGDVWKATDTRLGKSVAVKIFYSADQKNNLFFLTWANANTDERSSLDQAEEECLVVKNMLDYNRDHKKNWLGANRICECYNSYVSSSKTQQSAQEPLFLVMEMCGADLDAYFIERARRHGETNLKLARVLAKQLLEALSFLSHWEYVHHDLKPANVAVTDQVEVKVIDWGAVVLGNQAHEHDQGHAATPLYTPPEADKTGYTFRLPSWSYDTYAVGLMYMEMVCPSIQYTDFWMKHLSYSYIDSLLKTRCPTEVHLMNDDASLISSMVGYYGSRPNPDTAMQMSPLSNGQQQKPVVQHHVQQQEQQNDNHNVLQDVLLSNDLTLSPPAYSDGKIYVTIAAPANIEWVSFDGCIMTCDSTHTLLKVSWSGKTGYCSGRTQRGKCKVYVMAKAKTGKGIQPVMSQDVHFQV